MLRFAVLGPTEVVDGEHRVAIGGALPRRLLTALIAAGGSPVSDDRLAEVVWAGRPPARPGPALQVYVSRLRRALSTGQDLALSRMTAGYRLDVEANATDVQQFRDRTAAARTLAAAGHVAEARHSFESALRLWRGEPFADMGDDDGVSAERASLLELHAAAQEESAWALLATGDYAGATAELESLVKAVPYREHRWVLLGLALYRSGRQAEALTTIRRVRALLADDLGVDPGPDLQRLERRILAHDSGLLGDARPPSERPARPLSSFRGRDPDLALLEKLLPTHRIVTIVGTAGVGKTRLSIEYASDRAAGENVWLAQLADLRDPALLVSVIGRSLGVTDPLTDAAHNSLHGIRLLEGLLILDNCEHLTDEVGRLAVALLNQVPGLRILATSRAPLGADGEQILPLAPLPDDDAVELLCDRILAIRPTWESGPEDQLALRQLAAALDGIPLALELAAARTRTLGLAEITARLDDRFVLLGGVTTGLNPHETLRAAIAWSVDLLPGIERDFLLRLWPFEGGFTLAAAAASAAIEDGSALLLLDALVGRSVVQADIGGPSTRYRLFESVRAYCRSLDPDPAASREAHAAWTRNAVAQATDTIRGNESGDAMLLLHRELPNVRASIAHDLAAAPIAALRTTGRLMWFWVRTGLMTEGARALHAALAAARDAPVTDIVRAQAAYASALYVSGEVIRARHVLAGAVAHLRGAATQGHSALLGELRYYQVLAELPDGDPELARSAATEASALAHESGAIWLVALAEMAQGAAMVLAGQPEDARPRLIAAAEQGAACGQIWAAAMSELLAARTMLAPHSHPRAALPRLARALRLFSREGDINSMLAVLHTAAMVLGQACDDEHAGALRAVVHHHLVQYGMRPGSLYIGGVLPHGWYSGAPPQHPPTLEAAAALLTSIAASDLG